MTGPWEAFEQLVCNLGILLLFLLQFLLHWWLVIGWLAVTFWAINWRQVGPVVRRGAWLPLLLAMVWVALAWSQLAPSTEANFWWQLGIVALVVAITFFCGWLQVVLGWTPPEIDLEPPPPAHHHVHVHH